MQITKENLTEFLRACQDQLNNEQREIIIKILTSQAECETLWKELNQ
jgi:transposase-like protein